MSGSVRIIAIFAHIRQWCQGAQNFGRKKTHESKFWWGRQKLGPNFRQIYGVKKGRKKGLTFFGLSFIFTIIIKIFCQTIELSTG
jgi:hypothetical protein